MTDQVTTKYAWSSHAKKFYLAIILVIGTQKIILCDFISFMHWNALAFSKQPVNFHNDFLKNYSIKK